MNNNRYLSFFIQSLSLLLFFTFFMPAASGCNNAPIYPYEVKSFSVYLPYLWALSLSSVFLLKNIKYEKVVYYGNILYFFITLFWFIVWGYILHREILSKDNPPALDLIFPFFIWWLVFFIFLKSPRTWKGFASFLSRSLWTFSLIAVSFYLVFWINPHLYGLSISFFTSIGIFILGLFYDFSGLLRKI